MLIPFYPASQAAEVSDFQIPGKSPTPSTGPASSPAIVRTRIGLLLLVASEIGVTILWPFYVLAGPGFFSPLFGYGIDLAIRLLLGLIFFVGGLLIVSGREPFGPVHSQRTALGFAGWLGANVFGNFFSPYLFPALGGLSAIAVYSMVEAAIGLAGVALVTYNLQSRRGKILLWLGSIIGLGLTIAFDSQNLQFFPYYPTLVQKIVLALIGLSTALFAAAFLAAYSSFRNSSAIPYAETRLDLSPSI